MRSTEIFADPHYAARGSIAMVEDARVGTLAVPNLVPQLGGTPGSLRWLGPALGAHTEAVLGELGLGRGGGGGAGGPGGWSERARAFFRSKWIGRKLQLDDQERGTFAQAKWPDRKPP